MARPRAADDFETIRARLEELRLERAQAFTGRKLGSRVGEDVAGEDNRKDTRQLLRSVLIRKLAR